MTTKIIGRRHMRFAGFALVLFAWLFWPTVQAHAADEPDLIFRRSTVFKLLSLPLIVLTLGIFLLVVNAALLGITAALSKNLDIDGFGAAVLGGLLIAIFSWLAEVVFPTRRKSFEERWGSGRLRLRRG